jgi:hypothetical protein
MLQDDLLYFYYQGLGLSESHPAFKLPVNFGQISGCVALPNVQVSDTTMLSKERSFVSHKKNA